MHGRDLTREVNIFKRLSFLDFDVDHEYLTHTVAAHVGAALN